MENSIKKVRTGFIGSAICFLLFVLLTVSLFYVDVRAIGPRGSSVAFAGINGAVHEFFGVHMWLYTFTDWASVLALVIALGFAVLGFIQLVTRRSFLKVDSTILVLGAFYIIVIGVYLLFEFFVVNRRPVLIDGYLEASYPSSTTILIMCIMPTAIMQFRERIKNRVLMQSASVLSGLFTAAMVFGRMISGVHWFTDILGGMLISTSLVLLDYSVNALVKSKHVLGAATYKSAEVVSNN